MPLHRRNHPHTHTAGRIGAPRARHFRGEQAVAVLRQER